MKPDADPDRAPGLFARMRASPWASLLGRVGVVAAALAILAWIGRATSAGATGAAPILDAGSRALAEGAAPAVPVPVPLPPPPAAPAPAPATSHGRATPEDPVYVNLVDEAGLRRLPGVGAKRAEAIVSLRRRVGAFRRIEELMKVKGIGRAAIKKWRPLVRLDRVLDIADAGVPDAR